MTLTRYRGRGGEGGICMPHLFNSLCMLFLLCNLLFTTFSVAMTVRRTNPLDPAQAPLSGVGGGAGEIGMDERNAASDVNGRDGVRKWWAGDAVDTPSVYAATEGESQTVGGDVITSSSSYTLCTLHYTLQLQRPRVQDKHTIHIINKGGVFVERRSKNKKKKLEEEKEDEKHPEQLHAEDAAWVMTKITKQRWLNKRPWRRNPIDVVHLLENILRGLRSYTKNTEGYDTPEFGKALEATVQGLVIDRRSLLWNTFAESVINDKWIFLDEDLKNTLRDSNKLIKSILRLAINMFTNPDYDAVSYVESDDKVLPLKTICEITQSAMQRQARTMGKLYPKNEGTVWRVLNKICYEKKPTKMLPEHAEKILAWVKEVALKGPWHKDDRDYVHVMQQLLSALFLVTKYSTGAQSVCI
eukprot:GHVQ01018739.1.p1 GENE.GHVQ01018739.1~~GHVQ01018739.1.p1  ORF type:complete len:413 (-),score=60.58 GHVQ01018739.1:37-1275(-)